jgi:hypothetical protein
VPTEPAGLGLETAGEPDPTERPLDIPVEPALPAPRPPLILFPGLPGALVAPEGKPVVPAVPPVVAPGTGELITGEPDPMPTERPPVIEPDGAPDCPFAAASRISTHVKSST